MKSSRIVLQVYQKDYFPALRAYPNPKKKKKEEDKELVVLNTHCSQWKLCGPALQVFLCFLCVRFLFCFAYFLQLIHRLSGDHNYCSLRGDMENAPSSLSKMWRSYTDGKLLIRSCQKKRCV